MFLWYFWEWQLALASSENTSKVKKQLSVIFHANVHIYIWKFAISIVHKMLCTTPLSPLLMKIRFLYLLELLFFYF